MSRASTPEPGTYSGPEAAASSWEKVLGAPQQLSVLSMINGHDPRRVRSRCHFGGRTDSEKCLCDS